MKNKPVSAQTAFVCKYRRRPSPSLGKKRSLCSHWVGTVGKAAKKGFSQGQNGSKKHRPAGWLRREGHTRTAEGAYLIFCYLLPLLLLYAQHSFFDQYWLGKKLITISDGGTNPTLCKLFIKKTFWCFPLIAEKSFKNRGKIFEFLFVFRQG